MSPGKFFIGERLVSQFVADEVAQIRFGFLGLRCLAVNSTRKGLDVSVFPRMGLEGVLVKLRKGEDCVLSSERRASLASLGIRVEGDTMYLPSGKKLLACGNASIDVKAMIRRS